MKTKSIQKKILFTVALINVLVFSSILFYLQFVAKPANEENVLYLIRQNVETKAQEVNQWIEKRIVEYRTLAVIPAIRSMDARMITPIIEQVTNSYKLNDQTMETFSFIGKNGFCWINAEATENLIRYDDYMEIYKNDKEFLIGEPVVDQDNRDVVVFYYAIKGYTGNKESLIASAVPLVRIKEIVNTIQLYNSKTWIMDDENRIITADENYVDEKYIHLDLLEEMDLSKVTTSTIFSVEANEGKAHLIVSPIASYPSWKLITLVQDSAIHESISTLLTGAVVMMGLLLILIVVLGRYLSQSIMKPILMLQGCMQEARLGNLKSYYPSDMEQDEIYDLGTAYNQMLDDLSLTMERVVEEERKKQEAEMKMLQAQIKPHFLYNALDNIRWMARKHGAKDVQEAITALSTFFRLSLSHGEEMVTLKQEFQHTRSYLEIQKIRYKEKLGYMIELDEGVEEVILPKLILQPIVENSINHGIKQSSRNGTVQIYGGIEKEYLVLRVEDNGVGMSQKQVKRLYCLMEDESSQHFGLRNVLQRLKKFYKDAVHFKIESWKGIGTRTTIYIDRKELRRNV